MRTPRRILSTGVHLYRRSIQLTSNSYRTRCHLQFGKVGIISPGNRLLTTPLQFQSCRICAINTTQQCICTVGNHMPTGDVDICIYASLQIQACSGILLNCHATGLLSRRI